jgi:hypothetical protein
MEACSRSRNWRWYPAITGNGEERSTAAAGTSRNSDGSWRLENPSVSEEFMETLPQTFS